MNYGMLLVLYCAHFSTILVQSKLQMQAAAILENK